MDIEKLKRIKTEKGFTFKEISSLSGIPLRTIEDMFAGRTKPRIDTVESIEKALGINRFSVEKETKTQGFKNFKLKELRKSLCLTQQQVAKGLDISQQKYQQYESGKYQPDFDTLIRIADYFGVTIDYLLGRTNEKETTLVNNVTKDRTFDINDEEKALIITLRRSGNSSAYIKAMLTMLGENRKAEEILAENF